MTDKAGIPAGSPFEVFGRIPLRIQLPILFISYFGSALILGSLGMPAAGVILISSTLTLAIAIATVRAQSHDSEKTNRDWYARGPDRRVWPLIVGGIGISMMGSCVLNMQIAALEVFFPEAAHELLKTVLLTLGDPDSSLGHVVFVFTLVVVLAPLLEEFVFRGLLLNRLVVKTGTTWAVAITSLLFGLLHPGVLYAFAMSLVFCAVALQTQSLWAPTLLHALCNLTGFVLWLFLNEGGRSNIQQSLHEGVGGADIIVSGLLGAAGLWWFFRFSLPRMRFAPPPAKPKPEPLPFGGS